MQPNTAEKQAWRPKCAAPRLGYEQNQKATYYCSYLGHLNEVTFVGGISERHLTNTTHYPPTFQCEAMRVSAKPLQSGWVGIGRWVWVTTWKKNGVNNKYQVNAKKINNPKKKSNQQHTSATTPKCKQTEIINHSTKCKRIIRMKAGYIILIYKMSSWGVVVVGGKTSHLFLDVEDGWWYQVSGTWCN